MVILRLAKLNWELDCTPKAITEHVRIIKNRAKGGGASTPATPTKAAKSTSASGKKSTPKSKPRPAINDSPLDDEEVLPTTPKAAKPGKKRGHSTASLSPLLDGIKAGAYGDEDSYESAGTKRVKVEEADAC